MLHHWRTGTGGGCSRRSGAHGGSQAAGLCWSPPPLFCSVCRGFKSASRLWDFHDFRPCPRHPAWVLGSETPRGHGASGQPRAAFPAGPCPQELSSPWHPWALSGTAALHPALWGVPSAPGLRLGLGPLDWQVRCGPTQRLGSGLGAPASGAGLTPRARAEMPAGVMVLGPWGIRGAGGRGQAGAA